MGDGMNQGWSYENKITAQHTGKTVLEFYRQFSHSTEQEWRSRIQSGLILLDGQRTTPETPLHLHQTLVYFRPPWTEPSVPLDLMVLYQDPDLWVVNKPSGLQVLPGGKFLEHTVLGQLNRLYPDQKLVPIHRLGRGTSGLLLLARSNQARANLSQQMRDRKITKCYRALVGPNIQPDRFMINHPIGKEPYASWGYLYCASARGKMAESHCHVLKRMMAETLLDVDITTGRPHQIRIHLAYYGFPLLGDPLYDRGGTPFPVSDDNMAVPSDCGYWLHAHRLQFTHPSTHQTIEFTAPPPAKLQV